MKICPVCSTEYADDVKFCPNDGQTLRSAAPANNLVGQVIADRYHVVKKLGEGGMGQVYLAEHVKMGRRSAIKVMNPSMVHDPDAVARFNREASNASRITHPNVCAIYDFGETPEGLIYLAMEFIEGEPLTDLLEREGALSVSRASAIFLQTAEALQAAHDLGIVHRDLKPDNIMLTRRKDGADTVKVVDFGIAKAVGGDEAGQKVTKTGLVVGTPEFMSPEQLSGDTLDGRSDLYSLALVFYRTLSGKLPFEATTVQETMIKRLTDEPTPLAQARPDLAFPATLQPVLDTALARTPSDRYQTVAKFAADIAAVTGRPAAGGAPHTRSIGDIAGKTQLLETHPDGVTVRMSAQQPPPTAPSPPVTKRSLIPAAIGVVVILGAGGAWMVLKVGAKTAGNPVDSRRIGNVAHDTASNGVNRQTGGVTTLAVHDTARHPVRSNAPLPPPLPPPPPTSGIDPAKADQLLTALIEAPPAVIRDSATRIYDTPGVSRGDRAFAACMIARAEEDLGNHANAVQWANRGLAINSQLSSCRTVIQPGRS